MISSSANMVKATMTELMDLPDEVLLMIVKRLNFDSLLDVTCVSKHFHELVEPFIYESLTILHGEKALNLSHLFTKDKRRPTWVRNLLISTKFGQEHALMRLPPAIRSMDNLHELRLETPDCNAKKPKDREFWIELQDYYEDIFRKSSVVIPDRESRLLPNLKTCVLHFVDTATELYSMTRYSAIFLHPTLQSLTISCMSTNEPERLFADVPDVKSLARSTALEYLHLEECDLYPPSLELLLSFPRALKSLKISEGIRYDGIFRAGSSRLHGNVRPVAFVKALANTCKDSLESLSLSLGHVRSHGQDINHYDQSLRLNVLENLKHLEVNNRTLNLIRSHPECDHKTWKRLPTSLETFKVFSVPLLPPQHDTRRPYIPLLPCIIKEKQLHGVPNLKKVVYSYEHYESTDDDEMNFNDLLMNLVYNEANGNPPLDAGNANTNMNANQHANPILNLLQQAVGAVNPPQPQQTPAPAPAPTNFITAAMNPNLDRPPQHVQPPRFRWRTGPAVHGRQSVPELSRSEKAKYGLLSTIHDSVLNHFFHAQTQLQVDLVTLPRGYIPPYLFPEDKPKVQEAWFDSNRPMTPDGFVESIRRRRSVVNGRGLGARLYREDSNSTTWTTQEAYNGERERSRSDFVRRLRAGEFDDVHVPDTDESDDDEDDDDHVEDEMESLTTDLDTNLESDDDEMDVEGMVAVLVQEAQARNDLDSDLEDRSDSEGSVYVDAGTEIEMSEAEPESSRDREVEDDDDDFLAF